MLILTLPATTATQDPPGPSFKDLISLRSARAPAIAPDGSAVAYVVSGTDWENNRYDNEIWLVREGSEPFQLTRTKDGSSGSPAWSPDGRWIAFLSDREEKQQVHLIRVEGGEAWPLTSVDDGVSGFRWSPEGVEFTVGDFEWSPDGTRIAFAHRPDPLINSWLETDISVLDVNSGDIRPLVNGPGPDLDPVWSPDGAWILFMEHTEDLGSVYYRNSELARLPAAGGEIEVLTDSFDEDPCCARWTPEGIFFVASQGTRRRSFSTASSTDACPYPTPTSCSRGCWTGRRNPANRLQGIRPRYQQTERAAGGDLAQLDLVRAAHLGRGGGDASGGGGRGRRHGRKPLRARGRRRQAQTCHDVPGWVSFCAYLGRGTPAPDQERWTYR